jgi:hypothetical protein
VYDVSFETVSESGLVGLPFGGEARVGSNVVVTVDSSLDYDLQPVTVSGVVTVNGAAMPDSPEVTTRGVITFRDKLTGHAYVDGILPTGEGSYSSSLFAGGFDVSFEAASESGLMGMPYGGETALAQGCLPTMPCDEDPGDLTGTWTLYFDQASYGPLTIALSQDGPALFGPYQAPTYSGVFQGTRSGNAIDLSTNIPSSCAPFRLKATLGGACLLEGSATCGGFPTSNPRFTGLR